MTDRGKRIAVVGGWLLVVFLSACSALRPVPRERLVENLGPIVKLEERASLLTKSVEMLALQGWIGRDDAAALKESFDVYFVYHRAATIFLARGEIEAYVSHVGLAGKELDAMEATLVDVVRRSSEDQGASRRARSFEF